jgi:hypothetical protein
MSNAISPSAVVVPAPPNLYADRYGPLGPVGVPSREVPGVPAATAAWGGGRHRRLRRGFQAIGYLGEIVAVAYAFPLIILAVGVPVALFARLVAWIAGAL